MMKILTIPGLACLILLATATGCNRLKSSNKETSIQNGSTAQDTTKRVTGLTTKRFKQQIMDIDHAPNTWINTLDKKNPIVVDFYATWCGPCKAMAPLMEKMAERYKNQVKFYKVDVDECPELAEYFDIEIIPTFIFVSPQGQVNTHVGSMQEAELAKSIENIIP